MDDWTRQTSRMFAAKRGAGSRFGAPPYRGRGPAAVIDPGEQADRLSKAMDYANYAHDVFAGLAEIGGGDAGKWAFAPASRVIDAVGTGATLTASRQRGEPIDVSLVRVGAPWLGGKIGEKGGGALGASLGGALGSLAPGPGNLVGGTVGRIVGGRFGTRYGEHLGGEAGDWYAHRRGW